MSLAICPQHTPATPVRGSAACMPQRAQGVDPQTLARMLGRRACTNPNHYYTWPPTHPSITNATSTPQTHHPCQPQTNTLTVASSLRIAQARRTKCGQDCIAPAAAMAGCSSVLSAAPCRVAVPLLCSSHGHLFSPPGPSGRFRLLLPHAPLHMGSRSSLFLSFSN